MKFTGSATTNNKVLDSDKNHDSQPARTAYLLSVMAVLTITALAKLFSIAQGEPILSQEHPLIPISNYHLLLTTATIEFGVVTFLLVARSPVLKYSTILWLACCFIGYRIGQWILGPVSECPCLGSLTKKFPGGEHFVDLVLQTTIAYFLLGSAYFLWKEIQASKRQSYAKAV